MLNVHLKTTEGTRCSGFYTIKEGLSRKLSKLIGGNNELLATFAYFTFHDQAEITSMLTFYGLNFE